jgi:hypothetical protein
MLVNSIAMALIALFKENSFFEPVSYLLLSVLKSFLLFW